MHLFPSGDYAFDLGLSSPGLGLPTPEEARLRAGKGGRQPPSSEQPMQAPAGAFPL